jgi:dsDNA-binding SOS-regulon protein
MHDSKKDADVHDKMLELAGEFTSLLEDKVKGIDEKQAEEFGLFLARNKEKVIQACKGRPELLREIDSDDDPNVTPIKAAS